MFKSKKSIKIYLLFISAILFNSLSFAEEEEIVLQAISDQIQVITKDIKTLEKAVYQKSDVVLSSASNQIKSDGLNEGVQLEKLLHG